MRLPIRAAVAIAVAVASGLLVNAARDVRTADAAGALGPGLVTVNVNVHYSRFSIDEVHVRPGTTVRFIVHNDDPINHEFIVGDGAVHRRHQQGSERAHPPVPGEVSVGAHDTGETFFRFDRPGRYLFACHLPGHLAYGMKGFIVVDEA